MSGGIELIFVQLAIQLVDLSWLVNPLLFTCGVRLKVLSSRPPAQVAQLCCIVSPPPPTLYRIVPIEGGA
jgi:hypothetical protein